MLEKDWLALNAEMLVSIPGQLGVFELADEARRTIYIGFAGAKSLFGLRSAITGYVTRASFVRFEVNTAYRTRHRELLMAHFAIHDHYPVFNSDADTASLGRLSIAAHTSVGRHGETSKDKP